ncbi:MAG: hypothetical protein JNL38_26305 [Myxococcales bacterium]|nr:hypothetical protein [Myxococcales bacterium]
MILASSSFAGAIPRLVSFAPFHHEVGGTEYELESRTASLCGIAATVSLAVLVALLIRVRGAKGGPHPAFGLGPAGLVGAFFGLLLALDGPGGCSSAHSSKVVFREPILIERGIGYAGITLAVAFVFVLVFAATNEARVILRAWPFGLAGFMTAAVPSAFVLRHASDVASVGDLPHVAQGDEGDAHLGRVVPVPWADPDAARWRLDRNLEVTDLGVKQREVHAYHTYLGLTVTDHVKVTGHAERGNELVPLRVGARWRFGQWTESTRSASHYFLFWGSPGSRSWAASESTAEIWIDEVREHGPMRTFVVAMREGSSVQSVEVVALDGETYLYADLRSRQRFVRAASSEVAPGVVPCELRGLGHFFCQTKGSGRDRVTFAPPKPVRKGTPPPKPWVGLSSPSPGPIGWERDHGSSSGWQHAVVAVITLGMVLEGSTHTMSYGRIVDFEAGDPTLGEAPTGER